MWMRHSCGNAGGADPPRLVRSLGPLSSSWISGSQKVRRRILQESLRARSEAREVAHRNLIALLGSRVSQIR